MTQVSRMPLSQALEDQMHALFRRVIGDLRHEQDIRDFLDDILTPTEKTMLGKRLAIAILIERGYDHRTIHTIMHVSVATVSKVHYWLKNRGTGYRKVITRIFAEEKWKNQLEQLNSIIEKAVHWNRNVYYPRMPKEKMPRDSMI